MKISKITIIKISLSKAPRCIMVIYKHNYNWVLYSHENNVTMKLKFLYYYMCKTKCFLLWTFFTLPGFSAAGETSLSVNGRLKRMYVLR